MKYTISRNEEDQKIILKLGLNHEVTFDEDATLDDVVLGVSRLIETVVGISVFDLVNAVSDELNKQEKVVAE